MVCFLTQSKPYFPRAILASSSESERGGTTPPPRKRRKFATNDLTPVSSSCCCSTDNKPVSATEMHQENGSNCQNGDFDAHLNGDCSKKVLKKDGIPLSNRDKDVFRVIGQYLKSFGLEQTADKLVEESGVCLEHPLAGRLRVHILSGHWSKADANLTDLHNLLSSDDMVVREMRYLLLHQKYLELIEEGKVLDAIHCLRHELTPLKFNTSQVHRLSMHVMCENAEELKETANWAGKGAVSRLQLIDKLQSFFPVCIMLPPKRMDTLLEQAVSHQVSQCKYHNRTLTQSSPDFSLLSDHSCTRDSFPSHCTHVLTQHCDQVWFCRFSPDGTMLATGSKDGMVFVWSINPLTNEFTVKYRLEGHNYGVAHLTWSPDSKHLVACGPDDCGDVWVWDIQTGDLKVRMTHSNDDSLTSVSFHKDAKRFVTGGTRGQFYQCDLEGNVIDSWEGVRVHCISCLDDNKTVLAADSHFRLRSYNFEDLTDQHILQESHAIVSFTVSDDGRLALLNVDSEGIHIWDLKDKCLVRKLQGLKQGFYTIHSSFGGENQDFVVSGSEDSIVYIWHIREETPICTLEGHSQTVNCVHWNPQNPSMIASASDDTTVRIWGPAPTTLSNPTTSQTASTSRLGSGGDSLNALSGQCTPV